MKAKVSEGIKKYKFDNIVIDGRNQVFRYQHTMQYLKTSKGIESGMYHGFLSLVLKLRKDNLESRIIVAWEGGDLARRQQLSTYKDGRPKSKDSLETRIKNLKDMLGMLGVEQLFVPGYEADDIAAIISNQDINKSTLLVSEDRDWYQAMNKNSYVMRNKGNIYSYEDVKKQEGFSPEKYGLYVLLKGKKGNNIQGIPYMPQKLAREIINKSCSIEQITKFNNNNLADEKWIKIIHNSKEKFEEKYDIVKLRSDIKTEDIKCQKINHSHLKKLLKELEMFQVLNLMKMVRRLKKSQ